MNGVPEKYDQPLAKGRLKYTHFKGNCFFTDLNFIDILARVQISPDTEQFASQFYKQWWLN